jgi:putative ABC transport system ATP-binding protein
MIAIRGLEKEFGTPRAATRALAGVDLEITDRELLAVQGPSGSGKTTLLMTIAGMMRPTRGTVEVDGKNLYEMGLEDRARFRATTVGMVFQEFFLIPYLTVRENV